MFSHRWWNPTFWLAPRMKAMIIGSKGMVSIRHGKAPTVRESRSLQRLGFPQDSAELQAAVRCAFFEAISCCVWDKQLRSIITASTSSTGRSDQHPVHGAIEVDYCECSADCHCSAFVAGRQIFRHRQTCPYRRPSSASAGEFSLPLATWRLTVAVQSVSAACLELF